MIIERLMHLALFVCLCLGLLPSLAWAELPELIGIIKSDTVHTQFGYRITPVGDQNGDGKDDILIYDFRGREHLFYGREAFDSISTYDLRFDSVRWNSSNIGDVNGDNFDDLAIGGRSPVGWKLGLYHGGPSIDSVRDAWFGLDTLFGRGNAVRTNDINANGIDDIVCWSSRQSSVVLFELGASPDSVPDLEIFPANIAYDGYQFGEGIISGDFNGDGKTNLGVSLRRHPQNQLNGSVYLYWGGESFDTIPDMIITRPGEWDTYRDMWGYRLASLGDFNGDGYDDFYAGNTATYDSLSSIFFGGPDIDEIPDIITGEAVENAEPAGDINGDGYNDLLTSFPTPWSGIGDIKIYFGGPDADSIADIRMTNSMDPRYQTYFGNDCAGIGDFNGDGVDDFAFSAINVWGEGEVYIYSGLGVANDVGYEYNPTLPDGYVLSQNYPNPFNMSTVIEFALPERSAVTLQVYNVLGGEVRNLIDRSLPAGTYTVKWDGMDESGTPVSSGVYLYRLTAGNSKTVKKMVLLK